MSCTRIIPRLDIKGPNLVKGIHLEGLRVLGKPEEFAEFYYQQGADELIYMDVVASLFERNSLDEIISRTAQKVFIPITVGGGLRTIDDIRNVLRVGADKACMNTAAINNPQLISEAANIFGRSTIVVALEVIKEKNGDYLCYTDNGREFTGKKAIEWAQEVEKLGAGELVITSVDREGTGEGFDLELIEAISSRVSIPVIAHGGCGKLDHLSELFGTKTPPQAVSIASSLHYGRLEQMVANETVFAEGNTEFLKSGRGFSKMEALSISQIKNHVSDLGINIRK